MSITKVHQDYAILLGLPEYQIPQMVIEITKNGYIFHFPKPGSLSIYFDEGISAIAPTILEAMSRVSEEYQEALSRGKDYKRFEYRRGTCQ